MMFIRSSLAMALIASLGACGDDTPDTADTTPDTSPPTDTVTPDAPDTAPDTSPDIVGDLCSPNPCEATKPAACNATNTAVETYGAPTCADVDGSASCTYPVASTTTCTNGACVDAACVSNIIACDYAFTNHVTYITELRLANMASDGTDTCCFDFNDDDITDNKIGELVRLISDIPAVTADINQIIADNIASGQFTLLMEVSNFAGLPSDDNVDLALFYGTDTDEDHANNLTGEGTFTADISSFAPGIATPVTTFEAASVSNGALTAGPSVFRLRIPLQSGLVIEGDITDARLEGDLTPGPHGGLALSGSEFGAKLGGVFHQDQLFGALNNFVASTCTCLDTGTANGNARTVLEKSAGGAWSCNASVDTEGCDNTEGSTERPCVTLVNLCNAALLLVQPDIDAVGDDGIKESLSIGIWVKGTGAAITGVAPDICE